MEDDYPIRLAATLVVLLRRDGLNARQLAERLRRPYEPVRRWVAGSAVPRPPALADLADELRVPYDALLRPPASQEEAWALVDRWRREWATWEAARRGRLRAVEEHEA